MFGGVDLMERARKTPSYQLIRHHMVDTVITTPVASNDSGAAGWAIAVVVLAVVIIGGFVWLQREAPASESGTNINVTLPSGTGGTGGTGGATQ